ncbi:MAG: DUF4058 family protein [Gemmataceae bacterium]
MRSPFPGMDPYIEGYGPWRDFHAKLISEIERSLADQLPQRYFVQIEERSYVTLVEEEGKKTQPFSPDVKVTGPRVGAEGGQAVATMADPATALHEVVMEATVSDEFREAFVEIHDLEADRMLVTSIEVLSPSNKRVGSEGWRQFLRKRYSLLEAKVNVVEIDLLRGGARLPVRPPWPDSPYALLICRGERSPRARVVPAHYRERLPAIPVPLRPGDADLTLDLQPMIDAVYKRSRYRQQLDYAKPLDPPLPAADTAWLAEALKASEAKP